MNRLARCNMFNQLLSFIQGLLNAALKSRFLKLAIAEILRMQQARSYLHFIFPSSSFLTFDNAVNSYLCTTSLFLVSPSLPFFSLGTAELKI